MNEPSAVSVERAIERVVAGELVAYPTETVWGLGADARSAEALARLRAFKGRDADKPISLLVTGADALPDLGARLSPAAERLARAFWPGPLTLVLPCSGVASLAGVAREDGAVAFRCSSHPVARALATEARNRGVGPLTATSLNESGAPGALTRDEAARICGEGPGAPALVAGPDAGGEPSSSVVDVTGAVPGNSVVDVTGAVPGSSVVDVTGIVPGSSVVDVTGAAPRLLRAGAVSDVAIAAALAEAPEALEPSQRGAPARPRSPGSDA